MRRMRWLLCRCCAIFGVVVFTSSSPRTWKLHWWWPLVQGRESVSRCCWEQEPLWMQWTKFFLFWSQNITVFFFFFLFVLSFHYFYSSMNWIKIFGFCVLWLCLSSGRNNFFDAGGVSWFRWDHVFAVDLWSSGGYSRRSSIISKMECSVLWRYCCLFVCISGWQNIVNARREIRSRKVCFFVADSRSLGRHS